MDDPPPSAPVSSPPRALRPAELSALLSRLPPAEPLGETWEVSDEPEDERIDLLAHTSGDEPVSEPPHAVHPLRRSAVRRRLQ